MAEERSFLITVGNAPSLKTESPDEVEAFLVDLLTKDGQDPAAARDIARGAAGHLGRGHRYAPDDKVTELVTGAPVRAWSEEVSA